MELLDQEGSLKRKISLDVIVFMGFQMDYYLEVTPIVGERSTNTFLTTLG